MDEISVKACALITSLGKAFDDAHYPMETVLFRSALPKIVLNLIFRQDCVRSQSPD